MENKRWISRQNWDKRIQNLRESKGLSRQAICDLEDVLTTRQLQRIEKGQSRPRLQQQSILLTSLMFL